MADLPTQPIDPALLIAQLQRELEIEAALERVRARSLAMHQSEELEQVALTLFDQLVALGFTLTGALIMLFEKDKKKINLWISTRQLAAPTKIDIPYEKEIENNTIIKDLWNAIETGEHIFNKSYTGETKNEYFRHVQKYNEPKIPEPIRKVEIESESWTCYLIAEKNSVLGFDSWDGPITSITDHDFQILLRFARVFEQAYTRFLDLQKAEAQTREAQIEAALERVRAKSMSMKHSRELLEISNVLDSQVRALGIKTWGCAFNIFDEDQESSTEWFCNANGYRLAYKIPRVGIFLRYYEAAQEGKSLHVEEFSKEACAAHYKFLSTLPDLSDEIKIYAETGVPLPNAQFDNVTYFKYGYLLFVTYEPVPEAHDIFKRFAKVFEQTYTRFLDLQRAEAQAREATKQASLDRVRAEIASMRSAEDLQRITPLVWHELTTLGVPFIRCGVFIIDEGYAHVRSYLSTTDGHSLTVLDLPFGTNQITDQVVAHWKKKRVFQEHWDREQFVNWMQSMIEQHRLQNREEILGTTAPPESLYLNFIPFRQGMLYVGNTDELSTDEIELVQSLASAFSIAYARYDDFKQLEEAKRQVEATLDELKHTQAQLVQSEKMASLGELTAGIAHEIQNPLNFVNNYSEVNVELMEDIDQEIANGNLEEIRSLLIDLKDNESKIHHHGKRAEAIVRGMLLHSRKNSGTREPTNLNTLADEYFRLAYQAMRQSGHRATDESFEVECLTDFDPNLPLLEVAPSELGRVLLNVINNAFQACAEKISGCVEDYLPVVKITTRKLDGTVEISIADNGVGIPEAIKDKIFQPFFTTRPTGQGTGLGLSLAYDSVKAHGGELRVESEEGIGTTIVIILPIH